MKRRAADRPLMPKVAVNYTVVQNRRISGSLEFVEQQRLEMSQNIAGNTLRNLYQATF